jgi:hypothetical protein
MIGLMSLISTEFLKKLVYFDIEINFNEIFQLTIDINLDDSFEISSIKSLDITHLDFNNSNDSSSILT